MLFRLIFAMKFLAKIFTLCFVTRLLSLNRSRFRYFDWFWMLRERKLNGLCVRLAAKPWLESGIKWPGVMEMSSSYSKCIAIFG